MSKDIDLTAYMITASPKDIPGRPLPSELDKVVKQLHSIFPYKSYTLLESGFLRVSSGGNGTTEGVLPNREQGKMPTTYAVTANQVKVSGETEHASVQIGLQAATARPGGHRYASTRQGAHPGNGLQEHYVEYRHRHEYRSKNRGR